MSDYSISLVPKQSTVLDPENKAKEILDWLVAKDIVKSSASDCVLSTTKHGYSISNGARNISAFPNDLPFGLVVNGLEITTNRQVFDTGENFVDEVICPSCHQDVAYGEWNLGPWSKQESNNLKCPACGNENEINDFKFEPEWGFSNLGFTFWNWPEFNDAFLMEFKEKLGCDLNVVQQHI